MKNGKETARTDGRTAGKTVNKKQELVSEKEAAKILGITVHEVRLLVEYGYLKAARVVKQG